MTYELREGDQLVQRPRCPRCQIPTWGLKGELDDQIYFTTQFRLCPSCNQSIYVGHLGSFPLAGAPAEPLPE